MGQARRSPSSRPRRSAAERAPFRRRTFRPWVAFCAIISSDESVTSTPCACRRDLCWSRSRKSDGFGNSHLFPGLESLLPEDGDGEPFRGDTTGTPRTRRRGRCKGHGAPRSTSRATGDRIGHLRKTRDVLGFPGSSGKPFSSNVPRRPDTVARTSSAGADAQIVTVKSVDPSVGSIRTSSRAAGSGFAFTEMRTSPTKRTKGNI